MLPCGDRSENEIKAWYKAHARVGLTVVIREGYGGWNWYTIDQLDGVNPAKGRLYTRQFGAFYFSGKNCFHPKGQTVLVIPTTEVISCAERKVQFYLGEATHERRENGIV